MPYLHGNFEFFVNVNLLTFDREVQTNFMKSSGTKEMIFQPKVDYVLGKAQTEKLIARGYADRILKISDISSRFPNFAVYDALDRPTRNLLFYTGAGGYGDQIILWPLAKILHSFGFEITVACDPGNQVCWEGFDWLKIIVLPLPYAEIRAYDHFCIFDHLTNFDEHEGQLHPLDTALEKIGIDHTTVDPLLKRIAPVFLPGEFAPIEKKLGIFQIASSNVLRNFTPEKAAFILSSLARKYPDIYWHCPYDDWISQTYLDAINDLEEENIMPTQYKPLRALWWAIKNAHIVVTPDSMSAHVAGACGVPCVPIYGSTRPDLRSNYYPSHVPVWLSKACPTAGCHASGTTFPRYCPSMKGPRKMCEVMGAVEPQHVLAAAEKALNLRQECGV